MGSGFYLPTIYIRLLEFVMYDPAATDSFFWQLNVKAWQTRFSD